MSNNYTVYSLDKYISNSNPIYPPLKNGSRNTLIVSFEIFLINIIETY